MLSLFLNVVVILVIEDTERVILTSVYSIITNNIFRTCGLRSEPFPRAYLPAVVTEARKWSSEIRQATHVTSRLFPHAALPREANGLRPDSREAEGWKDDEGRKTEGMALNYSSHTRESQIS